MGTEEFLRLVLPRKGNKILAVPRTNGGIGDKAFSWAYKKFSSVGAMAEAALQFDAKGETVYYAINGFGEWYKDNKGKNRLRTQENVVACRALYDDFDVDPNDPRDYDTREEALAGVLALANALKLVPTVVTSGGGFHTYFHLDTDVDVVTWSGLAELKRDVTTHLKLKVDHSVDLDSARVLRPVGTNNRKTDTPRPVVVVREGKVYTVEQVRSALERYIEVNQVKRSVTQSTLKANPFDNFLHDYPPSSAHQVAVHCNAIRQIAEVKGDVAEPLWYAMLGTVKYCVEGEELCHEWSSGYAGYTREETQAKIEQWEKGVTSCEYFNSLVGCRETCQFADTTTHPISLGRIDVAESSQEAPTPPEIPQEAAQDDPDETLVGGVYIPYWPDKGFRWSSDDHALTRAVIDEDGVVHWRPFAKTLLYPVNRVRDGEGNWSIQWRALERNGRWREFFMPTGELASPDLMAKTLYNNEVFLFRTKGARIDMVDFAEGFVERLQAYRVEVRTFNRFGWFDNYSGFALGNKMIRLRGEETILYDNNIPDDLSGNFGCVGTLEEWIRNMDFICNRPGAELTQFCLCHAMGSVLVELFHSSNWHGLMVAITGQSGQGKTTNATLAATFFGNPELFNRQANEDGATFGAGLKRLFLMDGTLSIFDELSGRDGKELTRLGYCVANGKDKDRLRPDGSFATSSATVFKNSFATSNDSVHDLIAALPPSLRTEASQLRFFEIKVPDNYLSTVFPDVSNTFVEHHQATQHGTALRPYVRFIMENREWVERQISAAREKFNPKYKDDTSERFYMDCVVTAIVAGKIAERLGLISFDLGKMKDWAMNHILKLRESRKYHNTDISEYVAQYIASLPGRLIVTKKYSDARTGVLEAPIERLIAPAVGRVAIEDKRIFITVKSVNDWALDHHVTPVAMREELETRGYLILQGDKQISARIYLAKGTTLPSTQTRCYELNYDLVFGHVPAMQVVYERAASAIAEENEDETQDQQTQ